jgi:ADP-ribosyl-[dinitrogen reductase] hydrolase
MKREPLPLDRIRGTAVGAAVGDALGMPLEFGPSRPADDLERTMRAGRLPAGTFTDDTEMALALAESLLAARPLDPADLANRFVAWLQAGPGDVGIQTHDVLARIAAGEPWAQAVAAVQQARPDAAGNGSVMRCWPVALAYWDDLAGLERDSALQSRVTHAHPDCVAGCVFVNVALYHLLRGTPPAEAIAMASESVDLSAGLRALLASAAGRGRGELANSGWVRHTLESAVWGLLTTSTFEDALVQVVNLGRDADTAGAVVGALAGAAYGLPAIPTRWRAALRGTWPLRQGRTWREADLVVLAERLAGE